MTVLQITAVAVVALIAAFVNLALYINSSRRVRELEARIRRMTGRGWRF